jgi:phosphoribosylformylglycinamidine synthase
MMLFQGTSALSPFREQKLLQNLQQHAHIQAIVAQWVYFVDSRNRLTPHHQQQLEQLLAANPVPELDLQSNSELVLVVPRFGTISPWSSKATHIVHNCGLTNITRIERGLAYYLITNQPLSPASSKPRTICLHRQHRVY